MGPSQKRGGKRLVSEINVTPLVDVMLVLLIIFMVTAPMMTQGLNVDLPETTSESLRQEETPLVITVDKEGIISVGEITLGRSLLLEELKKSYAAKKDQQVILRADKDVAYGNVMQVMADIKSAGFDKIGMQTRPPEIK
jgi:biopolymer transport protein TolR